MIVHRENAAQVAALLGLPVVLKQPDSSFSAGVNNRPPPSGVKARICAEWPTGYSPSAASDACMKALRPNVLACVAALGFGDIPPRAWNRAAHYVAPGGLLAFNIKDDFLDPRYTHGFSELMRRMVHGNVARVEASWRYRHRLSTAGEPIYYTAMVVTKLTEIPAAMLVEH